MSTNSRKDKKVMVYLDQRQRQIIDDLSLFCDGNISKTSRFLIDKGIEAVSNGNRQLKLTEIQLLSG